MFPAVLDHFEPISIASLLGVIHHLWPTNCLSESIPSHRLKEVFDTVGSCILTLINTCLLSDCVPAAFKYTVVQSLLKKKNRDPSVPSNFRHISKLPFLSETLGKVGLCRLQTFLVKHDVHEKFQSCFKLCHSTETALLRVFNDCNCWFRWLHYPGALRPKAALDNVDHRILLSRLENCVGIKGAALRWFQSYLTDWRFSVQPGDYSSETAFLTCDVPQGSVLGPMIFSLYMLPLGVIF